MSRVWVLGWNDESSPIESEWVIWVWTRESEKDEGHPVERDRTTDVTRQHDTGRSQGDGKKGKEKKEKEEKEKEKEKK